MSSRMTAPAHTVGAVVFSSIQEGLVRVEIDSSTEGKLRTGKWDLSVLDEPHKPRTNAGVAVRWIRETTGWDQTSLGRFAVAMRDGDRCSDNRSPLGLAGTSGRSREP